MKEKIKQAKEIEMVPIDLTDNRCRIEYFIINKKDLYRIDEWFCNRGVNSNAVISINEDGDSVRVWYKKMYK